MGLSEMTCFNHGIAGAKRKLESEMETLHGDCDEMVSEASLSEEKCKKAMIDAARLADELRSEQELALNFERDRKLMECQVKDMAYGSDEDRNNHERMQALIDQLQSKIKSYKKQIEEAEEIAALNLAKYRNAHAQLSDAEESADIYEQSLAKTKTRGKSIPM